VQCCQQKKAAKPDNSHALENTQWAWIKKKNMLSVERKAHHASTAQEARDIQDT
jgi:hypothetical protein